MSDLDLAQRRQQRERQYELDRITAEYAAEYHAGHAPHIEDYVQRHPAYAQELLEFAVYFSTVGFDAPEPEEIPAAALSPAAERTLARLRERPGATSAAPLAGLVRQGAKAGYTARTLAEAVGLTTALLAKLEAHAIEVTTIPATLVRRFAETLHVIPEAVAAYLGTAGLREAGVFYYAEQPPTQQQESFLDAVRTSSLSPALKEEWAAIVGQELPPVP
jgi:hypothetical protein